jgi:hypothetical protein
MYKLAGLEPVQCVLVLVLVLVRRSKTSVTFIRNRR